MVSRWFSSGFQSKLWLLAEYFADDIAVYRKDIILASGCSHALEMCFNCVADVNDNILIPQPGFSLYVTLCHSLGIEPRFYQLKVSRVFSK